MVKGWFGDLLVIRVVRKLYDGRQLLVRCLCTCGNVVEVLSGNLSSGSTKSCGHRTRENARTMFTKHGMFGTPTYKTWGDMLQRCTNPSNPGWKNYGGRGIRVCRRWFKFENFLRDMGKRPADRTIGRIDNDGNYEPANCRWETDQQQRQNKRKRRPPTLAEKKKTSESLKRYWRNKR